MSGKKKSSTKPYPPKLQEATPLSDGTRQSTVLAAVIVSVALLGEDELLFQRLQQVCRSFYLSIARSPQGAALGYYRRRYGRNYASYLNAHCAQFYKYVPESYNTARYRDNAVALFSANIKLVREAVDPLLVPTLTQYDWLFIPAFLSAETKALLYDAHVKVEGTLVVFVDPDVLDHSITTGQSLLHKSLHAPDCPLNVKVNWRESADERRARVTQRFQCIHCWLGALSEHAPRYLNAVERGDPLINRFCADYSDPQGYVAHVSWWFDTLTADDNHLTRLDAGSLVDVLTYDRTLFQRIVTHPNITLCVGHARKETVVPCASLYDYFVVIQAAVLLDDPVDRRRDKMEMKRVKSVTSKGPKMMKRAERVAESCLTSKKSSYTIPMAEYLLGEAEARTTVEDKFLALWKGK